jgi:Fe-S-cluster containining protein
MGQFVANGGTYLSVEEGQALQAEFGLKSIFFDTDRNEYRTQTWNGRCVFFEDGGCKIHSHPFYPHVCKKFPWKDGRDSSLPNAYDAELCPEVKILFNSTT